MVPEAWGKPRCEAFEPRPARSPYNALTGLATSASSRAQLEDTVRLTKVFRVELKLGGVATKRQPAEALAMPGGSYGSAV